MSVNVPVELRDDLARPRPTPNYRIVLLPLLRRDGAAGAAAEVLIGASAVAFASLPLSISLDQHTLHGTAPAGGPKERVQ